MKAQQTLFNVPEYVESDKTNSSSCAKPRLKIAVRNQIEIMLKSLDYNLPEDHRARLV